MGSFQQIAVGAVCLIAAFAFGSYINHFPSVAVDSQADGQIRSRMSAEELGLIDRQPVAMPTLKHRAGPAFKLEPMPGDAGPSSASTLPPPSQLGSDTKTPTGLATPDAVAPSQPPDFAAIAAEFNNTPLALPDPARMPTLATPATPNLKNLADSFRDTSPQTEPAGPVVEQTPVFFDTADRAPIPTANEDRATTQMRPLSGNDGLPDSQMAAEGFSDLASGGQVRSLARIDSVTAEPESGMGKINSADATVESSVIVAKVGQESEPEFRSAWNTLPPDEAPASLPRKAARLPFGLTQEAKTELVRLQRQASAKIELQTTEFVNHEVAAGETLQSISTRYLGRPDFYLDIYLANRTQMRNPADVKRGMSLRVPVYRD